MARYSNEFKERAVARLLPPERAEVSQVSQEIGVSVATLERWRADALSRPARERAWAAAARLEAVIVVVPVHERARPLAGVLQIREALRRELRPVLCGAEQRFHEGPLCQSICRLDPSVILGALRNDSGSIRQRIQRTGGGASAA